MFHFIFVPEDNSQIKTECKEFEFAQEKISYKRKFFFGTNSIPLITYFFKFIRNKKKVQLSYKQQKVTSLKSSLSLGFKILNTEEELSGFMSKKLYFYQTLLVKMCLVNHNSLIMRTNPAIGVNIPKEN
ncbi:hypothetical protein BpHYR1_040636 [Brachionus plicatilis]|uniref:Uncharacterized protein n=1 Tax=Brachionus plicatilis TaxID=10195 RepID=A0A3M7RZ42_BRAPC|nr:hypothetical protein BpHYR1_040636 [Brachionus plicatilis]